MHLTKYFTQLPPCSKITWKYLLDFLIKLLSHSEQNLMSARSISIIFGPSILWRRNPDNQSTLLESQITPKIVAYFIENCLSITGSVPQ